MRTLTSFLAVVAASVGLAGCETAEQSDARVQADLSARLERYNGVSMAEFQSRTGMLPVDAYPVSDGKVFVFRTAPVYTTLPATAYTPAVTRSLQCQLLVRATNKAQVGTADHWIIKGTERTGGCGNLPV